METLFTINDCHKASGLILNYSLYQAKRCDARKALDRNCLVVLHNMRFFFNWYDLLETGTPSKASPRRPCLRTIFSEDFLPPSKVFNLIVVYLRNLKES